MTANIAADIEAKKSFPYDTKVWQKIMDCTLWKYPISDIYDKILQIKMGNLSLGKVFPDLIELLKDKSSPNDSDQNINSSIVTFSDVNIVSEPLPISDVNIVSEPVPFSDVNIVSEPLPISDVNIVSEPLPISDVNIVSEPVPVQDVNIESVPVSEPVSEPLMEIIYEEEDLSSNQENDICQFVESDVEGEVDPYIDITSKDLDILLGLIDNYINYDIIIKLNLKLTSWGYKSLQTIKYILNKIKLIPDDYKTRFSYNSIILNSPSYEFVIKSTNKALMDEIYPEGCSLEDSELGQKIINILKDYDHDIDYGIEIERNDIS
jgi:hypothetical protein